MPRAFVSFPCLFLEYQCFLNHSALWQGLVFTSCIFAWACCSLFLWELVLGVWRWSTRNKGLQFGAGQEPRLCQGIVQLKWLSKLLGALFLSEREWMMFAVINYHKLSNSNITDLFLYRSGGQESKSSSLGLSQRCHESFEAVGETQCLTSSCWGLLGAPWETTSVSAVCHKT